MDVLDLIDFLNFRGCLKKTKVNSALSGALCDILQ